MDAVRVHATMLEDGQLLVTGLPFQKGQRLELIVLAESPAAAEGEPLTARRLLESPLVGLWADRKDIGDSSEFARGLREKAENRGPVR